MNVFEVVITASVVFEHSCQQCIWTMEKNDTDCPQIFWQTIPKIGAIMTWGRCGSGGKSSRLAVGGLPVWSHPGRVEVSLSKTPNPQLLLMSWLVPCMAANRLWCVNVCVNGWMKGINCTVLWIKALYKCSPFLHLLKSAFPVDVSSISLIN